MLITGFKKNIQVKTYTNNYHPEQIRCTLNTESLDSSHLLKITASISIRHNEAALLNPNYLCI